MTVKEQLRSRIESMSEELASELLKIADQRTQPSADHIPIDDEAETPEERAAVAEAKAEIAGGARLIPLEEIEREQQSA